jgi:hypothetical protein
LGFQAASIAAARRIETSSHLLPEIGAHLLAATLTFRTIENFVSERANWQND